MKERGTVTAKGIYKHPQAEQFISVKQYMFVHRDGKKHLIVRYTNEMNTNIEFMKFVLTEMNSDGDVIATRKIEQKNLRADAGATFAPNEGIPISDECMDFKIKIIEAGSGNYTYRLRGRKVCVYYTPPKQRVPRPPEGTPHFSVQKQRKPSSRSMVAISIFIIALFIGASILVSCISYYSSYNKKNNKLKKSVAEIEYYECRELF